MPFFKDAMSHGNLHIEFQVEFPKKGDVKNVEELKKILPVPKNLQTLDRAKCELMMDFDKGNVNNNAEGGKGRGREVDDDEEGDMPRGGQRVQCAQQ